MRPNPFAEEFQTDAVRQLFDGGRWDDLESLLRQHLKQNPNNASSMFKLANLLALRGEFKEALRLFDKVWAYHWPGAVCLNNKGVTLAWSGAVDAAVEAFKQSLEESDSYMPAHFNLGVLSERFGQDGDFESLPFSIAGGTDPIRHFRKALESPPAAGSPEDSLLVSALFLWKEDLSVASRFGPEAETEVVDQAHRYFDEGERLIHEEQDLKRAFDQLDHAERFHPPLGPRVASLKKRARIGMYKEHLEKFNQLSADGMHEEARYELEAAQQLVTELPMEVVADGILESQIRDLAMRIRHQSLTVDWLPLQKLFTQARQRVQELEEASARDPTPSKPSPSDDESPDTPGDPTPPDPPDGAERPPVVGEHEPWPRFEESAAEPLFPDLEEKADSGNAGDDEGNGGETAEDVPAEDVPGGEAPGARAASGWSEYLKQICCDALHRQIRLLVAEERFQDARLLLEFSEVQWFARQEIERWRREIYTAEAEYLFAQGFTHQVEDSEAAQKLWRQALWSAQSGDPELAQRIEAKIEEQLREGNVSEARDAVQDLIHQGAFRQALQQLGQAMQEHPRDQSLNTLQSEAIDGLIAEIKTAEATGRWAAAKEKAILILDREPGHPEARRRLKAANRGLVKQWMAGAEDAWFQGHTQQAKELVEKVLALDPANEAAQVLERKIRLAGLDPEDDVQDEYENVYRAFLDARKAKRLDEALDLARRLERLHPEMEETQKALGLARHAYVHELRERLAADPSESSLEALEREVEAFLLQDGDYRPALEFREVLRRAGENEGLERRRRSRKQLRKAQKALLKQRNPLVALDTVKILLEYDDEHLAPDVNECRERAVKLLLRKIDFLRRESDLDATAEKQLEQYLRVLKFWRPRKGRELDRQIRRERRERAEAGQLEQDTKSLERRFDQLQENVNKKTEPLEALSLLEKGCRDLKTEYGTLRSRAGAFRDLRKRLLGQLGFWDRLKYRWK